MKKISHGGNIYKKAKEMGIRDFFASVIAKKSLVCSPIVCESPSVQWFR